MLYCDLRGALPSRDVAAAFTKRVGVRAVVDQPRAPRKQLLR